MMGQGEEEAATTQSQEAEWRGCSILWSGRKGRQKYNLLRLEIGHLVQCLWYKHEDMNVWPENTCKKLGTVTHACNLATGKAEPG